MPARSKPRAKRPSESDCLLIAENSILKVKNLELAKALTDYKMQCARLIQENSGLQKQLFGTDCEKLKMKECFKRIDAYSRSSLNMLILMSKDMTQIVHNSTCFLQPPANDYYSTPVKSNLNMSITNENTQNLSTNKTRVVKPMISGHTILSPTINLQRVPREQMEHLMNTLNDDESTDSDDEPNDVSHASLHSNLGRQNEETGGNDNESFENNVSAALSDDIELELRDHGLDTLQEEDENVSSLDSPLELHHGRLRSKSFEDIKVSMAQMERRCYNISGSASNEDPFGPCIKSNGSSYCATTDSSSDNESNSTDLSIESNKGDLNDTTAADVFNNSDALPEDPSLKNLSTVVNSNLDLSDYQNNLSTISSHSPMPKGNLQHVGKEISIQSSVNTTLINSYDPLEGPSSLLDNLHPQTGNKSKTLRSLDMGNQSIRNHTSTPYSPRNINKRQKKSKPSDSYESFIATPDISQVSPPPSNVTRRKIKSENHYQSCHLFDYNSDDVNVQKFRKCSVRICQLPPNKLSIECRQNSEVKAPTWNQDQRTSGDDNAPNSISNDMHWRLDIRCGPNSDLKEAEPLKTPKLEKTSPYKRARRNINVVNLKEPSLRKKLRRSR